jgi:serine/threonine-protein kinase
MGSTHLEGEANAYLQGRLRIMAAITTVAATALYIVAHVTTSLQQGAQALGYFTDPAHLVHLGSCVAGGYFWFVLRRKPLDGGTLRMIDMALLYIAIATIVLSYASNYEMGNRDYISFLAIWVIARAVFVPSTARRTFLLSLPAPLSVLALQLTHGNHYDMGGSLVEPARFWFGIVPWDQTTLLLACAIAALASGINFALRSQVEEAKQLGQYKLDTLIGTGSMGEVYRATHALLRRPTAVKLIRPEKAGPEMLQRFHREVRQTSRLTHPNTISIYDYGHTPENVFYYAMELLDGADLRAIVSETGPMPARRVIHILRQACGALAEAHALGLIHRDIKPTNLVLCAQGGVEDTLRVLDFGLVKDVTNTDASLTQLGDICGTPETLAPEVLGGLPATPQSDLYSLAVVGYFLLTGVSVYDASTIAEYVGHHLHSPPPPLRGRDDSIPADLERAILACLVKKPDERTPDVKAFRAALLGCADANRWTEENAASWWSEYRGLKAGD